MLTSANRLEGAVKWIRERALRGELLAGTFLNLGSSLTAEIAGRAGLDWVVIDLEHGAGDRQNLLFQLQALEGTTTVPLVRVPWNDLVWFKRVLDLGASGVMVPWVNSAEEARRAVAARRFPPQGTRGVASSNRASAFGADFDAYFRSANDQLLLAAQIETRQALESVEEIAAVDGVDVLFVGPLDLSVSLGVPRQLAHPDMRAAKARVVEACRRAGKAAGILLAREEEVQETVDSGFSFVGLSSDGAVVLQGMNRIVATFQTAFQKMKGSKGGPVSA
jgi:4-hydroxy-2-oxoheptanedioate aldolase